MSIQSGTSPGAIISAGETPAGAPVTSVFGRIGAVVAVPGDYGSDDITNESGVAGATVSDALDQLDSDISTLTSDDIANASTVVGATVSDALDALLLADTGFVPTSLTLTAGAGLTGGGDLSANRTFDVVANADGSILVNANDIQVGVLATDAQHGVRGGGTQHAVATTSVAGFLSAADKTKIDLLPISGAYAWVWADATARTAQSVVTANIGLVGFQTDMQREYKLLGTGSPNRWGEMPDSSLGPARSIVWVGGTTTIHNLGFIQVVISGTQSTRGVTGTTRSTQLLRGRLDTSTTAGIVAATRMAGNTFCPTPITGFRLNQRAVLGSVSTNMRWFMGITDSAASTNVDPGTFINSLGIGRGNGEANAQLYCNDAAGVATQVDLGASFPAATLNTGYECQIYTLTGASYTIQVRNLDTGAEFSQAFVANIPVATTGHPFMFYVTNNTDAVNISLDTAEMVWAQITR